MIFARYKGVSTPQFAEGKTYLARQEMEGLVVCDDYMEVVDESGKSVVVKPAEEQFEFLQEAYVVVTRKFNGFDAGDVVVGTDSSDDGRMLYVKGEGFCASDDLEILDRTNVHPGVVVLDSDGSWKKIAMVDEALWVRLEGNGDAGMRSPEEFRFPVSHDGELMVEPLVTCVDGTGQSLTTGKRYYLIKTVDEMLWLNNDSGDVVAYMPGRFRMG